MRAPKQLFWLEVKTTGKLKLHQRGGGKFTSKRAAEDRQWFLRQDGIETELYETQPLEWKKADDEAETVRPR